MSESTALRLPSVIRPIAMPATGAWIWMPASISASAPPQTEAIDELPFDSRISDTTRIVNGESSPSGSTIFTARSASAPWPCSRRFGARSGRTSPVENGRKL